MSSAEDNSIGVRVGVKSGGCAGMSYVMEYTDKTNPSDEIIEEKGDNFRMALYGLVGISGFGREVMPLLKANIYKNHPSSQCVLTHSRRF